LFRLIDGQGVYLTADAPPLLVEMRRVGPNVWNLVQVVGPKNAEPPNGAEVALLKGLGDAGVKIVATDPASALTQLELETRRGRDDEAGEPDDGFNDLGEVAA
jgi:hypothetical protein